jgi:hypothetical protein
MSILISGGGGGGGGATTLNGLSDVNITSVANGQVIVYNNTSGNWENQTGITGGLTYKGAFNATAGTPSIANALQGDFYVIDTAGTIYGQTWAIGDHLLINADMGGVVDNAKIDKVDNTDQVTSVNGQTGAVTGLLEAGNNLSDLSNVPNARSNLSLGSAALANDTDGVAEGAANLYFTNARADGRADARIAAADLTDLSDVSYTAGPGIDNFVLTFDNSTSSWGAEAVPSAPVDSVNGATGTVVLDSDDVSEGASNLYFTNARADARIAAADLTDLSDVTYTAGPAIDNFVLTFDNATSSWGAEAAPSAPVDSVNGATGVVVLDSDDVAEGAANLYFTDARADARADARIAAADLTDLSDVSYTAGPAIDNFVLTFDNATSSWGAEAVPSAPVDSVNGATGTVVLDSDDVAEGAANLYFTNARADGRIAAADLTDLADVSYTAGPGIDNFVLTFDNATSSWGAEAAAGGGSRPVVYSVSADTTIGTDTAISSSELERVYIVDSSGALRTMTLPQITGNVGNGYRLNIKRSGGNNVDITPNAADNIDGGTDGVAISLTVDKSAFTLLICDGTNWQII